MQSGDVRHRASHEIFLLGLSFKQWVAAHIIGAFLGAIAGAYSRPRITEALYCRGRIIFVLLSPCRPSTD